MFVKAVRFAFVLTLLLAAAVAQTIPAGTHITIRTTSHISSGQAHSGDPFSGTLVRDLVINGATIAKGGSAVHGKITYAKSSGRLHAPGQLTLRLTSIQANDQTVNVSTTAYHAKGKSHSKSNVVKIGGGTAAGALIGGLAGGPKGALIGAGVGAAAGTGLAAATGKTEAAVPAETTITFTTTTAATLKAK